MTQDEIDMLDAYDRFQMRVYGNILPRQGYVREEELYSRGIEEINRWAEYLEKNSEMEQLKEDSKH